MKIPFLDLGAQHQAIHDEILDALDKVVRSNVFILGPEVEKLEHSVAHYCGTKHAIGVSSGTDALLVSLMALGISSSDEVITTPFTFFATAGAIARTGAKPVFVDIEADSYNLNPNRIEQAINSKTKAIIPVHLYGQCADMSPLLEAASRRGIPVIEDAAQSLGAQYKDGRRAGSIGDVGCFSFFPSKNLGALGDGGMVITNNDELGERIRVLRVHGSQPKYYHQWIGGNFRLDEIQAAVLNVKLKQLDQWTKLRGKNAETYVKLFEDAGLVNENLIQLPSEKFSNPSIPNSHIYNQFIIRTKFRDQLIRYLRDKGVGAEIYYPLPLHLQRCFIPLGYTKGDFPIAEKAAEETLALPIYPGLSSDQQQTIVNLIKDFYASIDVR